LRRAGVAALFLTFPALSQTEITTFVTIKLVIMNTAEIKLDLFRRIDSLKEKELKNLYGKLIELLEHPKYHLSKAESQAIDEALECSDYKNIQTTEQVMGEANQKYPRLKFK